MAIAAGTWIGPYEIVSTLGEGGMGEVYRATDTRLRRQVATKVVPGVSGLWSLPASGGDATLLLAAEPSQGERFYAVRVMPDGRLLLHVAVGDKIRVEVLSGTATERRVVASGFERGWVVDDILVARQGGQWRAPRLDLGRVELTGPWVGVADVAETTDNPLGRSLTCVDGASLVRELHRLARWRRRAVLVPRREGAVFPTRRRPARGQGSRAGNVRRLARA